MGWCAVVVGGVVGTRFRGVSSRFGESRGIGRWAGARYWRVWWLGRAFAGFLHVLLSSGGLVGGLVCGIRRWGGWDALSRDFLHGLVRSGGLEGGLVRSIGG